MWAWRLCVKKEFSRKVAEDAEKNVKNTATYRQIRFWREKEQMQVKETRERENITIDSKVNAPAEKVWKYWTEPVHIKKWNNASDDWHTPHAENDLRVGGKFLSRMEAKDGSFGFDFEGVYTEVEPNKLIAYTLTDGRKVKVNFTPDGDATEIVSTFEAETQNSIEMQRDGWQAILNNFKKHAESE